MHCYLQCDLKRILSLTQFFSFLQYLKYRAKIKIDDPLMYLRFTQIVPKGHVALDNPFMLANPKAIHPIMAYKTVQTYRNISIAGVQELAENKLKAEIERCSLSGHFGFHITKYPTIRTSLKKIDLFHSTIASASSGQVLLYDHQYIKCIPKADGPYAGDSNSGEQISGEDWFDELPEEVEEKVKACHLKYCLQPAWMLPMPAHIAVPRHLTLKDTHSKWVYAGTSAIGTLYFHRYKNDRNEYIYLRRHTTFDIPRELVNELNFTSVGDNSLGCDQLAKAYVPIPITNV